MSAIAIIAQDHLDWNNSGAELPCSAAIKRFIRIIGKGIDNTKLGRWCWTRFSSKHNKTLRIYSAYCPNHPTNAFSVYSQHRLFFSLKGDPRCPRVAFVEDLGNKITEAQWEGDRIVVLLDGNMDMRNNPITNTFLRLQLEEKILLHHGMQRPETYKRNKNNSPIDGIWASKEIRITRGGYFDYGQLIPSADHRCVWMDISFQEAFGHNMPPVPRPKTRRLHCRDPRIVLNYTREYEKLATKHILLLWVKKLDQFISYPPTPAMKWEYEAIDSIRIDITKYAERKCIKLRMGQVAFSPELQHASRTIRAVTLLLRKKRAIRSVLGY
jgi:hypothetical protein